ncbi:baseplate wedge protein [Synechococcus phage ACG-2014d]|uniref:Baseplate wedge protein n=1 Tax=Synechococcus phage ACG-2014d TaxID=1493509 RepID=A0A0E3HHY3_9CAUD|nr:baseplate wedge protein [Synechococcus phage ACG-2014d]AIX25932.1 baseplate wedge protein [Synechococcus phage ACG-2014d]AIX34769.1 baseplate wedge protein [Synechococcus phage ACG-2014d]AIX37634.1 baseplate wedge protein [Synechococcus phage ACG-2014d]
MIPTNLTAMDFNSIKASIKDYLRTRPEFTDFDFEGATLSYLIDVLAYNTYYGAFNANMAVNESFLSSATVRDNVVSIAKLLNYTPRSSRAAKACIGFQAQSEQLNGVWPQYVTLKRGVVANGGDYNFVSLVDVVQPTDNTGLATFNNVLVREGTLLTYQYTVSSFKKQNYVIPSDKIDDTTITVTVKPNAQSTQEDVYVRGLDVTTITATSRVYFLTETEDGRYDLTFGDNVIGRKLEDGEVINISYLKTHEAEANDISVFDYIGEIEDQYGRAITDITGIVEVQERSQMGDAPESVESIKYTAPRDYTTQLRAVTAQDYGIIAKKVYPNADSVIAFGGDELSPPVYGKVYVTIKTKTGNLLNNATKLTIAKDLKQYSMASIEPVIIDAEFLYVPTSLFVFYDPTKTSKSISELQGLVLGAVEQFASQEDINNFGSTFSLSKYQKAIGLADTSVDSASVQTTLLKYLRVNPGTVDTYCTDFGSPLYDSNPSNTGGGTGGGDGGGGGGGCKKEPVIASGQFITTDRPDVIQYFEDDGFGNLRTYYNSGSSKVYTNDEAGTVDYSTGKICFGPVSLIQPSGDTGNIITTDPGLDDGGGDGGTSTPGVPPGDTDTGDGGGGGDGGGTDTDPGTGPGGGDPGGGTPGILPVQIIPSNVSNIKPATSGTVISLPIPSITVVPVGTQPPSTIPLNNLTPEQYAVVPAVITPIDIANVGGLNNISCF